MNQLVLQQLDGEAPFSIRLLLRHFIVEADILTKRRRARPISTTKWSIAIMSSISVSPLLDRMSRWPARRRGDWASRLSCQWGNAHNGGNDAAAASEAQLSWSNRPRHCRGCAAKQCLPARAEIGVRPLHTTVTIVLVVT